MGHEREITTPVDLCLSDGRLNPAAVGWSRHPLHRANLRGWGRTKRWEYWAVQNPDMVLALTVSDLDYAGLYAVWFLTPTGEELVASGLAPMPRLTLPQRAGDAAVRVRSKGLRIEIEPTPEGVRLVAQTPRLQADVTVVRPAGHEAMAVVVPWSSRRFQYTVKDNTLPATGSVRADVQEYRFGDDTWATWDFGRGKWPYRITWNWGSGAGRQQDRVIGLQVGGSWTDGTGSTENALMVDGVTHKISDELRWQYDRGNWSAPWRIRSADGRVDLTFTPSHVRTDRTELGILANDTHQCFGTWSGTVTVPDLEPVTIDGLLGWAEEVRNRW